MRAKFIVLALAVFLAGCLGLQKKQHAPLDENLRYMYITVYPNACTLIVTVEFKDGTPTFRDNRIAHIHEPISYSIDRRKVKRIHVLVSKVGWITQEREWIGEVPFDVFIKLETTL